MSKKNKHSEYSQDEKIEKDMACDNEEVKEDAKADDKEADTADVDEDVTEEVSGDESAVVAELKERVQRQMAEFDNFRKRSEKEKSAMFEMGASDIIKKLLPIVDNFERGFKTITDEEKETAFAKGMDMVYKQMIKMLEDSDVKPIPAVGEEFNPEVHNAVLHVEDEEAGENVIVEEFEKGYKYRDTVIRHSMVKVAN